MKRPVETRLHGHKLQMMFEDNEKIYCFVEFAVII